MTRLKTAALAALTIAGLAGASGAQAQHYVYRGPAYRYAYGPHWRGYYGPYWRGYYGPGWWGYPYVAPYYYYGPYGPPPVVYYGALPPPPVYDPPRREDYPPAPPPPAPPAPRPAAEPQRFVVYFPFDKDEITPDARAVIRAAADYAARNRGGHVIIVGHTDTSGSEAYNQPLSERRARAVRDVLAADGVDAAAVEMDWKGKHDLAVPTGDQVKEPLNRRVTILIEPAR